MDGEGDEKALGRSTIRTVVWRVMPLLLLAYLANYVDRINIGFAGAPLRRDLGLTMTMFGMGAGLFFVAYFLFEVPSTIALERVGARRWIARIMVSWGILSLGTAFATGAYSFYILRFLLGAAEAGFFPGIIFYIVCWFPSAYRARLMALFTLAIPISTVIGAPISGILLGMGGFLGMPGWKWLFVLEGVPAILLGFAVFLLLPDKPSDARWLSIPQRRWLEDKLAEDSTRPKRSGISDTLMSVFDPRVLAMGVIYLCNTSANFALAFFLPQIVGTLGFDQFTTGLIVAVPSAVGVIGLLAIGWLSDRVANHRNLLMFALVITGGGLAVAAAFGAAGASTLGIAALSFAGIGIHGLKAPFWALAPSMLVSTTAAGGIAWINSVGNLGGFFGPSVLGWLTDHFGGYRMGVAVLAALQIFALILTFVLRPQFGKEST